MYYINDACCAQRKKEKKEGDRYNEKRRKYKMIDGFLLW